MVMKAIRQTAIKTASFHPRITFPQRGQRRRELENFCPQLRQCFFLSLWGLLSCLCDLRVGMAPADQLDLDVQHSHNATLPRLPSPTDHTAFLAVLQFVCNPGQA
jgi:hypothetical protein